MVELPATIRNELGIHCRPSAVIITACARYTGQIALVTAMGRTDLRSLLELVSFGLERGTRVVIRVSGPDEENFCRRLVELFETHFDFAPLAEPERAKSLSELLSRTSGEKGGTP